MWPGLFYVSSLYFQQSNSNCSIVFLNSSLDSKLSFLNVSFRLDFFECCSIVELSIFPNSWYFDANVHKVLMRVKYNLFGYRALSLYVKDSNWIAIPDYCFNI